MSINLTVPDIGDFDQVEIIEILVKSGDIIKKNDSIVTLESDKSSVEVPATHQGKVEKINVKIGDKVSKGDTILVISNSEESIVETKVKKVKVDENLPKDTENIIHEAEETLPKDTENIIHEAEETLVLKKEVIQSEKKITKKESDEKIEIINNNEDIDPIETKEWIESLSAVLEKDGKHRAQYLIKKLIGHSYKEGSDLILSRNTPYINTISVENEKKSPGDQNLERKIRALIRWNAAANGC